METPKAMRARIALMAGLTILVAGCANAPHQIQGQAPSTVEVEAVAQMDCTELNRRATVAREEAIDAGRKLHAVAQTDVHQTALGVILFWPALFFLEGGETPEGEAFSKKLGVFEHIRGEAKVKGCAGVPEKLPADSDGWNCLVAGGDDCK